MFFRWGFFLHKCRLNFKVLHCPHRLQNRVCFYTFSAQKGSFPIYKKAAFCGSDLAKLIKQQSIETMAKHCQNSLSAGWAGTLHFIHHSNLAAGIPPWRLETVHGKEKKNFLLGWDSFTPLLLSVQSNRAQVFVVCLLLKTLNLQKIRDIFARGATLNPLTLPCILLCASPAEPQHFVFYFTENFHLAVYGLCLILVM